MGCDIRLTIGVKEGRFNRTNNHGTCLWCGTKLAPPSYGKKDGRLGPYRDNAFCTLRCGYAFGVTMARLGERLREYKSEGDKQ